MRCPTCNQIVLKAAVIQGTVEVQCSRCGTVMIITRQKAKSALTGEMMDKGEINVFPVLYNKKNNNLHK
jgi:phage FluMu protein Com